jgi:threonine/homoserine/homoserine lactone efflux protein
MAHHLGVHLEAGIEEPVRDLLRIEHTIPNGLAGKIRLSVLTPQGYSGQGAGFIIRPVPWYREQAAGMLDSVVPTLVIGFFIGLTGALAPGPTLVATINASLGGDWKAGLRVSLGHIVIETAIFFLVILGLAGVAGPYTPHIAVAGGIALIVFGILTIAGSRTASLAGRPEAGASSPYVAGFLTSAANPYFWIWWLSVGSALLISALAGGLLLAVVFMIGHWCADTMWYLLVSTSVARGRTILSERNYHLVMGACGAFLILFGVYYLSGPVMAYLPLA